MKILYITNGDDKYGGAQCLMELMEHIQKYRDVEVVLLNPAKNNLNSWCSERRIENYSVKYCEQMYSKHNKGIIFLIKYFSYFVKYFFLNPIAIRKIERIIDIKSFDIIHTNTSTIDIGMILAKRNKIKHVWHLREFGEEDMNFIPFRRKCYKRMDQAGGSFIAISDIIRNSWIKKGISEKRITRIYDGVKAEKIIYNKKVFSSDTIKIIFAGSIIKFKDQEQLIRALSLMSNEERKSFKVDFWGNGKPEYVKKLQNMIHKYNLESTIRFKGYTDNLYQKLLDYDVGINCSYSEAFGRVTVEYMIAGLLTIASDTGANSELIEDGETGILFRKDMDSSLSIKLRWIKENRDKCKNITNYGKRYAIENYAIEKNIEYFYEFYKMLIKN